jgi:hypothetical protein
MVEVHRAWAIEVAQGDSAKNAGLRGEKATTEIEIDRTKI